MCHCYCRSQGVRQCGCVAVTVGHRDSVSVNVLLLVTGVCQCECVTVTVGHRGSVSVNVSL